MSTVFAPGFPYMNGDTPSPLDVSPIVELGTTGLRQYSGYVREEFIRELEGTKAIKVYRQMAHNDSIVGAILFAMEMLARQVSWRIMAAPAGGTQADAQAEWLRGALFEDMSQSWPMLLSEIMTFLPYGFSFHELVYKRRTGDKRPSSIPAGEEENWAPSKFDDGMLGWRKWPIRSQDTLLRWDFDAQRSVRGFVQFDPVAGKTIAIPIEKGLLFRAFSWKGNPEGRSILRTAYRSWYRKQHLENIQAIGAYRDLAGIPYISAPQELFYPTANAQQLSVLAYLKKMGTSLANDEQACILMPQAFDANGHPLFDMKLLASGGQKQFDVATIIQAEDIHICQSVLADMLMIGHTGSGSRALAEPKMELFNLAMNSFLDAICEVINRHAIPRLWTLNAQPLALMPQLVHGEVDHIDIDVFSQIVLRYAQAGFDMQPEWPFIRQVSGFPDASEPSALGIGGNPGSAL